MSKAFHLLVVAAGAAAFSSGSSAQDTTLLAESFSYAAGSLTSVSGGTWVPHSGTNSNPVQVNGAGAAVLRGGSAEDVNRPLGPAPLTAGTLYASFTVDFSSGTLAATGVSAYFLHFKDAGTGFRGRVFVGSATVADADLFRLGIENDGSDGALSVSYSGNLDRTAPHEVTVAYDLGLGTSRLWVNAPVTGPATAEDTVAGAAIAGVSSIALRQGGNATSTGNYSGLQVDNLTVVHQTTVIPEPSTWALAMAGVVVLGWASRRR